jgi:hypothetical protein
VVAAALDARAEQLEQLEHRVHVADARHVAHDDHVLGEGAGSEDGQRAVLVAGRHDGAGQRHAAVDDELLHGGRACERRKGPGETLG